MSKNEEAETKDISENVDELRNVLKEKGYLDNRLESFFLRRILRGTSNLAVNVWFSFIVGCLGSLFMTLPMILALLFRNRQLLESYRDIAILGVYFFVIFGAAVFALVFTAGSAVGLLQRIFSSSRNLHSKIASRVAYPVIIVLFTYLIFWWKLSGNSSPVVSVIAVCIALIVSLIVGKLTSSAAYAYSMKLSSFDLRGKGKGKVGKISIMVFAVVLISSGVFFILGDSDSNHVIKADDYNIYDTGVKTIVIGIDGLDYESLIDLTEKGHMPFIKELMNKGCLVKLESIDCYKPPVVWTGIATGHTSDDHGIKSFDTKTFKGISTPFQSGILPDDLLSSIIPGWKLSEQRPVSSIERKRKAFWEILGEKGLKCGVANWWATWPVTECSGFILSERAIHKYVRSINSGYDFCPEDVLSAPVPEEDHLLTEEMQKYFDIDHFYLNNSTDIVERTTSHDSLNCLSVYLPGLDIFRTNILSTESFHQKGPTVSSISRLYESQISYCCELDKLLFLKLGGLIKPDTTLLIIGDPGRSANRLHAEGFLLASGEPFKNTHFEKVITEYDITPLILAVHGFPFADDMKGSLHKDLLTEEFLDRYPSFSIRSYGEKVVDPDVAVRNEFDDEMMENLRSLGYL